MRHSIMSDQRLSGVFGYIVTARVRALKWLRSRRKVFEKSLFEMLVAHVLPECIAG